MKDYREADADNHRWHGFEFRPGDVIIDAPSKSGTTWTQLLVALLVFDGPDFPAPIGKMSFWMEQKTRPVEEAHAVFAAQTHRRFIKSHTPLDGVPYRDDVVYVCTGRDPRDAAVSMTHHSDNLDRVRLAELIGSPEVADYEPPPFEERIDRFIDGDEAPGWNLRFLAHHYRTFWERRELPNVGLFHFTDLRTDLTAEIQRLAEHLGIHLTPVRAAELADEASLARARSRATEVAPEAHMGLFRDVGGFFRTGAVGEGASLLMPAQAERYGEVVAATMPPDLATWVHGGWGATPGSRLV